MFISTIKKEVQIVEKEEKYELYLCERPIRKVFLLGTIIEMRLKTTRDDTTKGERQRLSCSDIQHVCAATLCSSPHIYNMYVILLFNVWPHSFIYYISLAAIFKLEDGTGVIECWKYVNNKGEEAQFCLKLGDFVTASGVLYLHQSSR